MVTIRLYKPADFNMLAGWWSTTELPLVESNVPETTYIAEIDGIPAVSLCLHLMNNAGFCLVDNFIGNPNLKGEERKEASRQLFSYCEKEAKKLGYSHLSCMTSYGKIKEYVGNLGYTPVLENVTVFLKRLT